MAIYVNTDERLTHEDVAQRLARAGQQHLATAVRLLGQEAAAKESKYASLLNEYTQMVLQRAEPREVTQPVSYKPGPRSDG